MAARGHNHFGRQFAFWPASIILDGQYHFGRQHTLNVRSSSFFGTAHLQTLNVRSSSFFWPSTLNVRSSSFFWTSTLNVRSSSFFLAVHLQKSGRPLYIFFWTSTISFWPSTISVHYAKRGAFFFVDVQNRKTSQLVSQTRYFWTSRKKTRRLVATRMGNWPSSGI